MQYERIRAARRNVNFSKPRQVLVCGVLLFSAPLIASASPSRFMHIPLTVNQGVPLRIKLTKRVPITKADVPVEGRLVAPIYVYNRQVLPVGTLVLGRVSKVQAVSRMRRAQSILSGDFTPWRTATVTFTTLILKNGARIPISTVASAGTPIEVRLVSGGSKPGKKGAIANALGNARRQLSADKKQALQDLRGPSKLRRLWKWAKSTAISRLPYRRQFYPPGTEFTAAIERPLRLGTETLPPKAIANVGAFPPPDSIVHARLVTPLNSATAKRGSPVQAVVTEPLFSSKRQLIIPQGTRLEGAVIRAKPARWLHRNGSLRFTFLRMETEAAQPEFIPGSLHAVVVPRKANLRLSAEGGVKPKASKKRYLAPALTLAVAVMAATPDRDAVNGTPVTAAAPGHGGALGTIVAGGWGLGLIGSVAALVAQSRIVSAALGFYGAAGAIYSNLIARGREVSFPANTPMEIRLGNHDRPDLKSKLAPSKHG